MYRCRIRRTAFNKQSEGCRECALITLSCPTPPHEASRLYHSLLHMMASIQLDMQLHEMYMVALCQTPHRMPPCHPTAKLSTPSNTITERWHHSRTEGAAARQTNAGGIQSIAVTCSVTGCHWESHTRLHSPNTCCCGSRKVHAVKGHSPLPQLRQQHHAANAHLSTCICFSSRR